MKKCWIKYFNLFTIHIRCTCVCVCVWEYTYSYIGTYLYVCKGSRYEQTCALCMCASCMRSARSLVETPGRRGRRYPCTDFWLVVRVTVACRLPCVWFKWIHLYAYICVCMCMCIYRPVYWLLLSMCFCFIDKRIHPSFGFLFLSRRRLPR